mgnify:CR=1 FL=1|jgi:hypothetical protein
MDDKKKGYRPWKNYGDKSHSGQPGDSPGNSDGSSENVRDDNNDDKTFSYDQASKELQHKIIEKLRHTQSNSGDDFYAQDEGILYDTESKPQFAGHDIFKNVMPKYWDLDGGRKFIQFDLEIKNSEELRKYLEVSKSVWEQVEPSFENKSETNTMITFTDDYGSDLDEMENDAEGLSGSEIQELHYAQKKWNELMDKSLKHLDSNYEYHLSDKALIENAQSNDYEFDEDGDIV